MIVGLLLLTSFVSVAGANASQDWFPDVDPNAWYAQGVLYSTRWIQGYDDGTYGPTDVVTRAQLATVLHRLDVDRRNDDAQQDRIIEALAAMLCLSRDSFLAYHELNENATKTYGEGTGVADLYARALNRVCDQAFECHSEFDLDDGTVEIRPCLVSDDE